MNSFTNQFRLGKMKSKDITEDEKIAELFAISAHKNRHRDKAIEELRIESMKEEREEFYRERKGLRH